MSRLRLREARERAGLTQEELARKIGIDRSTYTHYERGDRVPSLRVGITLAECLGIDVGALVESDEPIEATS